MMTDTTQKSHEGDRFVFVLLNSISLSIKQKICKKGKNQAKSLSRFREAFSGG
jgi:hypothetical protein